MGSQAFFGAIVLLAEILCSDLRGRCIEEGGEDRVGHGLMCKTRNNGGLRRNAGASTIELFSFRPRSRDGLPRQPIRGGAVRIR